MSESNANRIGNFICAIADDVLRDVYVRGKHRGAGERPRRPRSRAYSGRRGAGRGSTTGASRGPVKRKGFSDGGFSGVT